MLSQHWCLSKSNNLFYCLDQCFSTFFEPCPTRVLQICQMIPSVILYCTSYIYFCPLQVYYCPLEFPTPHRCDIWPPLGNTGLHLRLMREEDQWREFKIKNCLFCLKNGSLVTVKEYFKSWCSKIYKLIAKLN